MTDSKSAYRRGGNSIFNSDIDELTNTEFGSSSQFLPRKNIGFQAKLQSFIQGVYRQNPKMVQNLIDSLDQWLRRKFNANFTKLTYLHILLLSWTLLLWYGERHYPYSSIRRNCHWQPHRSSWKHASRVALIADPQLIDDNTYPGRPKTLLSITKYIVDSYLRRNWIYLNEILDPDANIFLGDLFDGGREWTDDVWREEYNRWNEIFTRPPYKRTIMSLPGNHDIGYGDTLVPHALQRFKAYFGEPSSVVDIGDYTFVLLDTISMMNTVNESIYEPPNQFLHEIDSISPPDRPRILLTHVPLYRPPETICGKHRESKKSLPYIHGFQYQTLVTPQVSSKILSAVKPIAIFSGDDHDACHVQHKYYDPRFDQQNPAYDVKFVSAYSAETPPDDSPLTDIGNSRIVDEYTVKSISMAMGISRPGIQLVTLGSTGNEADTSLFHTSICFMPSPFYAFILYGIFALVTLGVILLYNIFPTSSITRKFQNFGKASPTLDSTYSSLPLYNGSEKPRSPLHRIPRKSWSSFRNDAILLGGFFFLLFIYLNNALFD